MKRKANIYKTTGLAIATIATPCAIVGTILETRNQDNHNNNINLINNNFYNQNLKGILNNSSADFLINSDNKVTINVDGQPAEVVAQNPNSICSSPLGVFIPTSKGTILLDPNTMQVKWKLSNPNIGSKTGQRIFHTVYNRKYSQNGSNEGTFISLYQSSQNTIKAIAINATNGTIYKESAEMNWVNNGTWDFSAMLVPIFQIDNDTKTTTNQLDTDSYVVMPRSFKTQAERNKGIYQFWLNSDSNLTLNETRSLEAVMGEIDNDDTNKKIVISSGAYYDKRFGNTFFNFEWYESGEVKIRIYNDWRGKPGKTIEYKLFDINEPAAFTDEGLKKIVQYPSNVMITSWDDDNNNTVIEFSSLLNLLEGGSIGGSQSKMIYKQFTMSEGIFDNPPSLNDYGFDFNQNNTDYDIQYAYYDYYLNKWIANVSYVNSNEKYGVMSIDFVAPGWNKDWSLDGNRVKLYETKNYNRDTFLQNPLVPMVSYNASKDTINNLITFTNSNTSVTLYNGYDGNPVNNVQVANPYAYNTWFKNQGPWTISIDGFNDISISNVVINQDLIDRINEKLQNDKAIKDKIKSLMSMYRDDTQFEIIEVQPKNNQTLDKYLKGILPVKLRIKNAYIDGSANVGNRDINLGEFLISGFKLGNPTTLKINQIAYNGQSNLADINENDLLSFVRNNKDAIFNYLPEGFDNGNITNIEIKSKNLANKSVDISITINKYYDDQATLVNGDKKFDITITNINPVSTALKTNEIAYNGPNNNLVDINENDLLSFVRNNKNNIFNLLPQSFNDNNIISVKFTKDKNRQAVNVTIALNCYYEGDHVSNNEKTFSNLLITGINSITTGVIRSVLLSGIAVDGTISKFINSDFNKNENKEILKQWIFDKKSQIFNQLPQNITINDFNDLQVTINQDNSINVSITISKSYIGDYLGSRIFNFKITNLTQPQQPTEVVGLINVNVLEINEINANTYTSDIINSNEIKNKLIEQINNQANWNKFFRHAPDTETEIKNRPMVKPNSLSWDYYNNSNELLVNFQFLQQQVSPNEEAIYRSGTFIIEGFNASISSVNNEIVIINDKNLVNKEAVNVTKEEIKTYIENNKDRVFNNVPKNITFEVLEISDFENEKGKLTTSIQINNVKTQSGYGTINQNITLSGFVWKVLPTSGKTLTIDEALNAGITGLSNSDYAFEFEAKYKSLLVKAITNNAVKWFNNSPEIINISQQGNYPAINNNPHNLPLIDKDTLKITSTTNNGSNDVLIVGQFLSYSETSLNSGIYDAKRELVYKELSINIKGFNRNNTSVKENSLINVPNSVIDPLKFSFKTGVEKLNGELKSKLIRSIKNDLNANVQNKSNDFTKSLNQLPESSFNVLNENNKIYIQVSNVPVVIDNGSKIKPDGVLKFELNVIFNDNKLESNIDSLEFKWDDELFKLLIGSDVSGFVADWNTNKVNEYENNIKIYLNNNKGKFVHIVSSQKATNEQLLNNVIIESVILENNINESIITGSITYTGYKNGDLKQSISITKSVVINLKPNPSPDDYERIINEQISAFNSFEGSAEAFYNSEDMNDLIKNINENILANSPLAWKNKFKNITKNDFVLNDKNNTIAIKDGITIGYLKLNNQKIDVLESIDNNTKQHNGTWSFPEWGIYAIIFGFILFIALLVTFISVLH